MNNKINKIYNGNNIEVLKDFEDNSIDSIITDFPYGLQDVDALKLIKEGGNNVSGFLGKKWDCLPSIEMLSEFLRVLKTGGWLITTFTPRQDLQCVLQYRLLEAGFDISFSSTYWAYASGFPKACNYGKVTDRHLGAEREKVGLSKNINHQERKDNNINQQTVITTGNPFKDNENQMQKVNYLTIPASEEAKHIDGLYSNSLKPAVEIIIVAQKPFKGAKFQQALKWYNERKELLEQDIKEEDLSLHTKNASGGVRIDDAKIPVEEVEKNDITNKAKSFKNTMSRKFFQENQMLANREKSGENTISNGRFPANLLCSDDCLNVGRINQSSFREGDRGFRENALPNGKRVGNGMTGLGFHDEGDFSRYFSLDNWTKKNLPELYKLNEKCLTLEKDAEKIYPFFNVAKPSINEKNLGLEEFEKVKFKKAVQSEFDDDNYPNHPVANTHPTSKPISLFAYLVSLYSSENDVILDPFCGSGTTCIASILTNRKFVGIDITEEYCKIAEARIEYWKKQKEEKEAYKDNLLV